MMKSEIYFILHIM